MLLIEECRPPLFSNRSSLRQSKTSLRWRRHVFLNRFKFGRNVNITLRLYYCNKLHSKTSLFITVTMHPLFIYTMFPFEPAAMYNIAWDTEIIWMAFEIHIGNCWCLMQVTFKISKCTSSLTLIWIDRRMVDLVNLLALAWWYGTIICTHFSSCSIQIHFSPFNLKAKLGDKSC